jgi:enterochelin esterase-like enzyme
MSATKTAARLAAALAFAALVAVEPTSARAHQDALATFEELAPEIRHAQLDGPSEGEQRSVFVWRPANARPGPLPVLYMADGAAGVYVAAAGLRAPILEGTIPPIVIVGMDAHRSQRILEYVPSREARVVFARHMNWFLNTVIPWSERVAGASRDPAFRAVGGYSNGAEFALAAAEQNPEMFAGVLAHSPVNWMGFTLDDRAVHIRWVLTAGRHEYRNGEIIVLIDRFAREIRQRPSMIRRCVGNWDHEGEAWRDLSPGSVAWLFQFPASPVETERERQSCRMLEAG